MDILNFIAIMVGAALVLVGTALMFYYKKARARQRLLNPHRDHLYHYTKPRINIHQAESNEHNHHRYSHLHNPEA